MAVIDLSFVLVGTTIPLDHGYALFSALSRIVPELHGDRRVGVHPIRGRQSAPGVLSLTERSRLKLRLSAQGIAPYIAIAGKELDLEGQRVQVGIPRVEALVPAANLAARLVTFHNALDAEAFEADVRRELARMEIAATPQLIPGNHPKHPGQPVRRVTRVKGRRMVAYPLCVVGLTAEESIRLQEEGLGGRRRMGCGVFSPFSQIIRSQQLAAN
jgi:CRISPR-associated protein Cas6